MPAPDPRDPAPGQARPGVGPAGSSGPASGARPTRARPARARSRTPGRQRPRRRAPGGRGLPGPGRSLKRPASAASAPPRSTRSPPAPRPGSPLPAGRPRPAPGRAPGVLSARWIRCGTQGPGSKPRSITRASGPGPVSGPRTSRARRRERARPSRPRCPRKPSGPAARRDQRSRRAIGGVSLVNRRSPAGASSQIPAMPPGKPPSQPRPAPGVGANPARPAQPAPAKGPSRERGHRHARARRGAADRLLSTRLARCSGTEPPASRTPRRRPAGPPQGRGPRSWRFFPEPGLRAEPDRSSRSGGEVALVSCPLPPDPRLPDFLDAPCPADRGWQTAESPPSTSPPTGTCTRPATASYPHARGQDRRPRSPRPAAPRPGAGDCSPPRARKPPSRPAAPGRSAPPWSNPAPTAGSRELGSGNTRRHRSHLQAADVNESRSAVRDRRNTRAPAADRRPAPGRGRSPVEAT